MLHFIKWVFKTVLILTGVLPLFKCSSGYKENNGKVSFNGKEITDKNFIVLNDAFAKDSAVAYYKDSPITQADVATFTAIDEHYAKDIYRVYYCDEFRESQNYYLTKRKTINTVENALPGSFTLIGHGYAKDSFQAFFEGTAFRVQDISTLQSINREFVKDRVRAYFYLKPVSGSDGKSFEIINSNYAKDTANIYFYGHAGEVKSGIYRLPCDKASFRVLEYPFSKDTIDVFYENKKINGAHSASFMGLQYDFSKDKNHVYFMTRKIAGADAATFNVCKENELFTQDFYYAKDQTSVFWQDKKVKEADVDSFTPLGQGYGSDRVHVFYKAGIIKDADPTSFKVYPHGFGNADAEDTNNTYFEGIRVREE
jgi:hypothetical protein